MEAIHQFGPNVVGFQLDIGGRQRCITGCYLVPNDTSRIDIVFAALNEHPRGSELLVAGELNANLDNPEGYRRKEEITAAMTTAGL